MQFAAAFLLLILSVSLSAGEATVQRLRLADDLVGKDALQLDETDLELAGGRLRVPLQLNGTLRVRANAPGRCLEGSITTGMPVAVPVQVSFIASSLREVVQDDWRVSQRIAGQRTDPLISLPESAWGTPVERKAWGIAGSDQDWENVSVQFDGWLNVSADTVDLATRTDDGSRMWLDRDGDGQISPGEWGSNGWGTGHGATTVVVHSAVPRGIYRFRLQVEEGNGGNCISLLWSDRTRSAGALDGQDVIPASAFVRPAAISLVAGPDLAVTATISGAGGLIIDGPAATWLPGASCDGPLQVLRGNLILQADLTVPALEIAAGARVVAGMHHIRAGRVQMTGTLDVAGGTMEIGATGRSSLTRITGQGTLRIIDGGQVRLDDPGQLVVDVVRGSLLQPRQATTAGEVQVAPSLGAELSLSLPGPGPFSLALEVEVPVDAPPDLGLLAFARDRHTSWHQQAWPGILTPGRHQMHVSFDPTAPAAAAPGDAPWNADAAARTERAGIRLWSVRGGGGPVRIRALAVPEPAPGRATQACLTSLRSDGPVLSCGQRWDLSCLPQPFPADPYDPEEFALDGEFIGPDGRSEKIPGFYMAPCQAGDGGDRVEMRADGSPSFHLRWRPRVPGIWRCRLVARWRDGSTASAELPLRVDGPAWDSYLRVDPGDRRFFTVDGAFHWPVGANLHAVSDERSVECLATRPSAQRGIFAYDAYLARFGAAGVNLVEVWMAAWNLGIEWSAQRPGFAGAGRYNQGNAAQLDTLLDHAWERGMRVVLAVNHLGQGSDWCAPEWLLHPNHRLNGGWLEQAGDLFTDPRALAYQERYRRYLIARYADHPAVASWKLWTEIDLTNMRDNAVPWHERASRRWHELDTYRHPVTTHWCGTYGNVSAAVVAVPGIDFPTIDAYHGADLLAELLRLSTLDPQRGLARLGKPVLVSEYGVNWNGGSREQLFAETASSAFAALVSGHAGAPLCWWFERLDQDGWWHGFRAIRAFSAGEDLRGEEAKSVTLNAIGTDAGFAWAQAWMRPGRVLGYVIDRAWGTSGGEAAEHSGMHLALPGDVAAGRMTLEWWDADLGSVLARLQVDHPGGPLALACPPWRRHLAFKLWRSVQ